MPSIMPGGANCIPTVAGTAICARLGDAASCLLPRPPLTRAEGGGTMSVFGMFDEVATAVVVGR